MDTHNHNNNTPNISLSTPLSHYISSSSDHLLHHHNQQHQQFWIINNNNSSRAEQPLSSNLSIYHHHSFNLNHHENDEETAAHGGDEPHRRKENDNSNNEEEVEKESMFEKPLTPSDVGKLNRLVIPKQHAEKYFPLGGNDSAVDKGLLLSFEDESGKSWRFRYSYWNSSQSYVLTKGWSRYVKEKRLDAGDVVLFERHRTDVDRLFIGWRRRAPSAQDGGGGPAQLGGGVGRGFYNAPMAYPAHHHHHHITGHYQNNNNNIINNNNNNNIASAAVVPYQTDCIHAGLISPGHQNQTTRIGNNNNNNNNSKNSNNNNSSKILRLFGVNMECHEHEQSEPSTPDGSSSLSSQDHQTLHHFYPHSYYSDHHRNHMDFTFSRDVKTMRDRRG